MRRFANISFLIIFLLGLESVANNSAWSGGRQTPFLNNWSIGIAGGFTSYYGDLSLHDGNYFNKIRFESKGAISLIAIKHLNNFLGLSGQILSGGFKADYSTKLSFETDFLEYNLQLRLYPLSLIFPGNIPRVHPSAFAGVGQFFFRSVQFQQTEGSLNTAVQNTGVPEFVFFFGGGINYHITDRLSLTSDIAIRQAQNDKLDNVVKNDDFDYYSFLSVGISYFIPSFIRNGHVNNLLRSDVSYKWR